jgi:hypothetical protein
VCEGQAPFTSPEQALEAVSAGLAFLNTAAAADLPAVAQAECLRGLGRVEAAQVSGGARAGGGLAVVGTRGVPLE